MQELIHAYRVRGHLMADTDPLEYRQRQHPDLDVVTHGLTLWDLDREFATGGFGGKPMMKLRDILGVLRDSYCRTVGIEYMHIQDPEQRRWIQAQGRAAATPSPTAEEQLRILRRLNAAEAFETFLQTKYVGQKRFSLEGGESRHPAARPDAVAAAAEAASTRSASACRTAAGSTCSPTSPASPTRQIFREFEGNQDPRSGAGLRRREVPPGHRGHVHRAEDGEHDQGLPRREPVATSRRSTRCSRASRAPSRTASTWAARRSPCCRC